MTLLDDAAQLIHDAKNAVKGTDATSRELSLVLTKLDEASMWLNVHHENNPTPPTTQ